MGPALGPKSVPEGLLHGLNARCWAHAGLRMNGLMLRGYTARLDTGLYNMNAGFDAGPVQLGAVRQVGLLRFFNMGENGDT